MSKGQFTPANVLEDAGMFVLDVKEEIVHLMILVLVARKVLREAASGKACPDFGEAGSAASDEDTDTPHTKRCEQLARTPRIFHWEGLLDFTV